MGAEMNGRLMSAMRRLAGLGQTNIAQSAVVFGLKVAAGLGAYLLFALIARTAGPSEFGAFSVLFSVAMMIGTAGSMGQQVFLVKEVPKTASMESAGAVYCFSALMTVVGAALSAVSFVVISPLMTEGISVLALMGGALMCMSYAFSQTTLGMLRVQGHVVFGIATRDLLWRVLSAGGLLMAIYCRSGFGRITTGLVLFVMGMSLAVIVLWQGFRIWRSSPWPFLLPNRRLLVSWGRVTAGLTLVAIISSADLYVFSIVLSKVVPDSDVGPFFASLKTVEIINLFLMSVALVVGPSIARSIARGDREKVQAECNAAIVIQGLPAVVATLFVIAVAPLLLGMFDESFAAHSLVLRVLAIGVLINALTGATGLMLQLIGLHWRQVAFQGGSLLASLLLLPWLVHRFGIVGAALSFVFSKVLWNVLAIATIRARLGVDPSCLGVFGTGALNAHQSFTRLKLDLFAR